jgi:cardiolipin synthase
MYRHARKRHGKIFAKTDEFVGTYSQPIASEDLTLTCSYLHNVANFVPYKNTKLKYFPSGASTFDDIIERLKSAQDFIYIEYFAIADGVLLNRILDILLAKLSQGVEVKIIYDDMGSRVLSRKTIKKIKKAGGMIRVFNPLLSRFSFALNYRDHRKIVVIDGKTAYTGGVNLADEYINEKRMHGYWKDNGLRLDGEAVDALTLTFLRQWEFIVRKPVDYASHFNKYEKVESSYVVLPYADGPEYEQTIGKSVYENIIASAKKKVYIMTPYYIPDDSITQCIINKALEGVDVRIVLPSIPDKYYVYLLTKDYAEKLIKYGVKVYYMKDAFVHAKTVLTEECAVIGSINFDLRSFYQQFENAVLTNDPFVLCDLSADFEQSFADSVLMDKPEKVGAFKAFAIYILRIVSPLM